NGRAQSSKRTVAEGDVTTMRTRDVARDRESQTSPALILVARIIKPQEGLEHFFTQSRRNSRPVIVHGNCEVAMIAVTGNGKRGRFPARVRPQIGQTSLERSRPHGDDRRAVKDDGRLVALTFRVGP